MVEITGIESMVKWLRNIMSRTFEAFLLREAEQEARRYTDDQQAAIQKYSRAAAHRISAAISLREPNHAGSALALLREAALLSIFANLKSRDASFETRQLPPQEIWQQLDSHLKQEDHRAPPASFNEARAALESPDWLALDQSDPEQARTTLDDAEAAVRWLQSLTEARSTRQIRWSRVLRIALGVVAVMVVGYGLVRLATPPTNLALGKAASASSYYAGSPPADGVINGELEPTYGTATRKQKHAWIQVDLEKVQSIEEIKVFNRGDVNFDDGLPMLLELSIDGKKWERVDRRKKRFTQLSPWVYSGEEKARYVRLRTEKDGLIAISELEVY